MTTPSAPGTESEMMFEPTSAEFARDRYAIYRRFREQDPVHWRSGRNGGGRWVLFRHADVSRALTDSAFGRQVAPPAGATAPASAPRPFPALSALISSWMIFRDHPEHDRMRNPVARAFTPSEVARLRTRAQTLVETVLDELETRADFDVVEDFACTLSLRMIAELIGLDGVDLRMLRAWSLALAVAIDAEPTPAALERAELAARELTGVVGLALERRRREPRGDLLSQLLAASGGEQGLDEHEIISNCILLVGAGHETTTSVIGFVVACLLAKPECFERLAAVPSARHAIIEECLRYESPVQFTARVVKSEVELGGRRLVPGQQVDLGLGSANRDPEVFAEPERLDLERKPGEHLAFGGGRHFCLGAPLARMEAAVALEAIARRGRRWQRVEPNLTWRPAIAFRALERLVVRRG
ncbi:MAG: cytochrome P450 [Planctomycetes bacterium]|nr:cytochrome P450 [Planctomycetota bacterium]